MNRRQRKSKQRRKIRWWRVSLVILALFIAGGGTWLYYVYHNVKSTVDQDVHESVDSIDNDITKGKVKDQEPLNILLLGVDERANDRGRSDTMIILTLDPNNERMQMVSIPRDTRTEIIGRGTTDKINHSYAFGGSDMAVDTVENFLDIEIDYFSTVNMEGLEQLVDAVDGVTVENELAFSNGRFDFPEGELYLDGREALAYVRMRKDDPQGDAGRNERQRQVIEGVLSKGASFSSMNKFHDILDVLGDNVSTNMDFSDMRTLATDYRGARKTIDTYQVEGDGTYIGEVWYLLVPDGEVEKVHHMIKDYPETS
ncbi:LCP family protein [Halobacillus andaensis]|uniref:LCP family glycopolymer transferase n=1 Tax=Halobacillus andaensis TaxID=1176239 RepID=UPI001663F6AC|nr:LCP family protein [Halobacillus andaensis]MBP2004830.1 LCP family protein required for cell wall assembly [Halobacillus andaensis]